MLESPKVAKPLGLLLHFLSFLLKYATIAKQQRQSVLKKGTSAASRASALRKSRMTVPWVSSVWGVWQCEFADAVYRYLSSHSSSSLSPRSIPIPSSLNIEHTECSCAECVAIQVIHLSNDIQDPLSSPNARKVQLDLDLDQSREGTPEIEHRKTLGDWLVIIVGFVWKYFT